MVAFSNFFEWSENMRNKNREQRHVLLFRLVILAPAIVLMGMAIKWLLFPPETHTTSTFELFDGEVSVIRQIDGDALEGLNVVEERRMFNVYALHAQVEQLDAFSFFDDNNEWLKLDQILHLEAPQDTIYITFGNFITEQGTQMSLPMRENFVLKVFYNLNEIEFRPLNQALFDTEFLFHLPEGYQVEIPIQLSKLLDKDDYLNHLTVAIFANPQHHTVDPLAEWYIDDGFAGVIMNDYGTGIVSNFAISFGGDLEVVSEVKSHEIDRNTDSFISGLAVDPEFFTRDPEIWGNFPGIPPSPWRVLQGEEIKMAFAVNLGIFSEFLDSPLVVDPIVDRFQIIGLLNWEQVELSGDPYIFGEALDGFQIDEGIQGTFTIAAPDEPGLYDFIAFAISNPIDNRDFPSHYRHIEIAMRFTIEVQAGGG